MESREGHQEKKGLTSSSLIETFLKFMILWLLGKSQLWQLLLKLLARGRGEMYGNYSRENRSIWVELEILGWGGGKEYLRESSAMKNLKFLAHYLIGES